MLLYGELYFLATAYPSATSPYGTVFKFVDPSRRAPPGKCKQKPLPVKVRGKKIPFVPRELTVLDTNEKPTRPPPRKFKLTAKPTTTPSLTSARDKQKPGATDDFKSCALKNTNGPKNRTTLHEKNRFQWKKSQKCTNKTQTDLNVRTNRTMQNTLKVKRKQAKNAKAL
ncbi:hypothetical protein KUCAC02_033732 [Chaenocephalus aceratus]|nr:hypothetical protein KUCAC02_033732 [Chaenocephalus aceratus]